MQEAARKAIVGECSRYLNKTYSLTVPNDWLTQCVEFLIGNFSVYAHTFLIVHRSNVNGQTKL